MSFTPDGRSICYFAMDRRVHLHDAATGKTLKQFEGHHFNAGYRLASVVFSPDGRLAAFGDHGGQVAIYEVATGKKIGMLLGGESSTTALAFSADNRLFAAATGASGTIHVWDIAASREIYRLSDAKRRVLGLAFSADGTRLVSGSEDTTGLVWDTASRLIRDTP